MSEPAGSLAEEAAKLVAAVEDLWRERIAPAMGAVGDLHTGPECVVCPICQLLSAVRAARPEVFEHLTEAGTSLFLAAKAALDAHERSWARRRTAPVQHIDIG